MNWSQILGENAKKYPQKDAIIFEGKRISYRELNKRVNSLAKGLLDLGICNGDVVGLLMYNCPEFIEATYAINKIGAIWLPLNFRLAGDELAYILDNAGAKLLITEPDFHKTILDARNKLPYIKYCVSLDNTLPAGWLNYEAILSKNPNVTVPDTEVELDDLQRLMYTSGTTAYPKGVMITYGNFYWKNASHIIECKYTPEDRSLIIGPLYHVGGMDLGATPIMQLGGTIVILRKFNTVQTLELIDTERITHIWAAPAMINMLLQEPTIDKYDVSSVRLVIDGGEKMPLPLIEKFLKKFPNAWFSDGYGLTETVSGDTLLEKSKMIEKIGSTGRPVPMLRVRIVDDNGKDVPAKSLGEIILKGPKVFKGYWKNEKATAETLRDGWLYTGDIGYLDEEGYLYIVDRKKDMIISGGENIASAEVERVIYELPQVLEVAVIGIPHPKWLEVPKAFVVVKPGQSLCAEDVLACCTKRLAKFKVPKEVEFISVLPRNPSGKVLKRELRKKSAG